MRDVAVVGAGMVDFGALYDRSTDDLVEEAFLAAVDSVDRSYSAPKLTMPAPTTATSRITAHLGGR